MITTKTIPHAWIIPGVIEPELISNKEPQEVYKNVLRILSKRYNIHLSHILSRTRDSKCVYIRQLFVYFMRRVFGKKATHIWLAQITYGNDDHTNVMYAVEKFKLLIDANQLMPAAFGLHRTVKEDYYSTIQLLVPCLLELEEELEVEKTLSPN